MKPTKELIHQHLMGMEMGETWLIQLYRNGEHRGEVKVTTTKIGEYKSFHMHFVVFDTVQFEQTNYQHNVAYTIFREIIRWDTPHLFESVELF